MRPIAISLSPNTEPDDVRLAWRLLLAPWRWGDEKVVARVEQQIGRYFGREAVLVSSGRSAITAALQAWGVGRDDEVIVQAFTCLAVPAAVRWAGATPVYADIDPQTHNFDVADVARKMTPRTRVIIVQHTFGVPGPLRELRSLADKHNIRLLEDCAHALGGEVEGAPLGSFGDAAVLSFGRDKMLSSVFGGAVVGADATFMSRVRAAQAALPYPPWWWVGQQLLHPIVMSVVVPLYFMGSVGKLFLVAAQQLRLLSKAVSAGERRGGRPGFVGWRYSPALAWLLERQWQKLPRYTARRRGIVRRYKTELSGEVPDEAALLRFPLRVRDKQGFLRSAREQRMLLGDWYDAAVTPCDSDCQAATDYAAGSCPEAERAAKETVNLPTYPLLVDEQVDTVCRFAKRWMA